RPPCPRAERADVDFLEPAHEPRFRGRRCGGRGISGIDQRSGLRHSAGRGHVRHDRRVRWHDRTGGCRVDDQRGRGAARAVAPAMEMKRLAVVVALSVAMYSLTACAGRSEITGTKVRIAVGGQNQLIYLPVTLARELGFYREEGLEVELQDHAGGAKALQAMIGGSADVVSGFYDHTIQMAAEGRPLVAFVTMLRFPGLVLATSPQSPVTRIEDLTGRVVGVTSPGSSSHMLLTFLLHRHAVPVESVSVTGIGGAGTAIAAIERGKVDAGMLTDPAFTIVQRRAPGVRILADLRHAEGVKDAFGTGTYPASVLYASADWVHTRRETAARLARAIT